MFSVLVGAVSSVLVGVVSSVLVGDVLSVLVGVVPSVLVGGVSSVLVGDVLSVFGDEDSDGDSGGEINDHGTGGGDGDGTAVTAGVVVAGIVSTVKDLPATKVNIKVVITLKATRRHFFLRSCLFDALVFSSITRVPSLQRSVSGSTVIKGIPSTRQNASNSSA